MNKYQEALDRIDEYRVNKNIKLNIDDIILLQELIDKATPKKPLRFETLKIAYEMKNTTDFGSDKIGCEAISLLTELVDKETNPTLEEVKKEWEELGYVWEEDLNYITLKPTLSGCWISIQKEKDYLFSNGCITLKIHQLLTKTFKALGWI